MIMGVWGYKHSEEARMSISRNRRNKAVGEASGQSVLTELQVLDIVQKSREGFGSHRAIGCLYGVKRETVTSILNGRSWSHVTGIECRAKLVRKD